MSAVNKQNTASKSKSELCFSNIYIKIFKRTGECELKWKQAQNLINTTISKNHKLIGEIPLWWILEHALPEADCLFLAMRTERMCTRYNREVLCGFACVEFTDAELYLNVLCARGAGKQLVDAIKNFAFTQHIERLTLSAIPSSINFYRKQGFYFLPLAPSNNLQEKTNSLLISLKEPPEITSQAELVVEKLFASNTEAENDKEFSHLLQLLIKYKILADKQSSSFAECREDGYYMTCHIPKSTI